MIKDIINGRDGLVYLFILAVTGILTYTFTQFPTYDAHQYYDLYTYVDYDFSKFKFVIDPRAEQLPITVIRFDKFGVPIDTLYIALVLLLKSSGFTAEMIYFVFLLFILTVFWRLSCLAGIHKRFILFAAIVFNPWILQALVTSARQMIAMALIMLFCMMAGGRVKYILASFACLTHWSAIVFFTLILRFKYLLILSAVVAVVILSGSSVIEPILIVIDHKVNSQVDMNTAYSNFKFLFHIILLVSVIFTYNKGLVYDKFGIYILLILLVLFSKIMSVNPERIVDYFLPLIFLHIFYSLSTASGLIILCLIMILSAYSIPIIFVLY